MTLQILLYVTGWFENSTVGGVSPGIHDGMVNTFDGFSGDNIFNNNNNNNNNIDNKCCSNCIELDCFVCLSNNIFFPGSVHQ